MRSKGHTVWHVGSEFPNQRSNSCSMRWKLSILTTGPPGKSLSHCFLARKREEALPAIFAWT